MIRFLSVTFILLTLTGCGGGDTGVQLDGTPPAPNPPTDQPTPPPADNDDPLDLTRGTLTNFNSPIDAVANLICDNNGLELVEINPTGAIYYGGFLDTSDIREGLSFDVAAPSAIGDINGDGCDDILIVNELGIRVFIQDPIIGNFNLERFDIDDRQNDNNNSFVFNNYIASYYQDFADVRVALVDAVGDEALDIVLYANRGLTLHYRIIETERDPFRPSLTRRVEDGEISNILEDLADAERDGFLTRRLDGVIAGYVTRPRGLDFITIAPDFSGDEADVVLHSIMHDAPNVITGYNQQIIAIPGQPTSDFFRYERAFVGPFDITGDAIQELVFISDERDPIENSRPLFVVAGSQLQR